MTWFHFLRHYLHARRAYQVGKLIAPRGYRVSDDKATRRHDNIWTKYRCGKHAPRWARLVQAEERCPGSAACFEHMLWQLLSRPPRTPKAVDAFGAQFNPNVRRISEQWRVRGVRKAGPNLHVRKSLLLLDWMDSLAAILLELHRSLVGLDALNAHRWARTLCQSVLVHHEEIIEHGIGRPLVDFLNHFVLSEASYGGLAYVYPAESLCFAAHSIGLHVPKAADSCRSSAQNLRDSWRHTVAALNGRWGWDLFFSINPIRVAVALDARASEVAAEDRRLFDWGHEMLSSGTRGQDWSIALR